MSIPCTACRNESLFAEHYCVHCYSVIHKALESEKSTTESLTKKVLSLESKIKHLLEENADLKQTGLFK